MIVVSEQDYGTSLLINKLIPIAISLVTGLVALALCGLRKRKSDACLLCACRRALVRVCVSCFVRV